MRVRRLKNKLVRALTFSFVSSFFIVQIINYQHAMTIIGPVMFAVAFYFTFKSEKLINLAHSSRYRFSFLRQVFNYENFVHSKLPNRFQNFSVIISILLILCVFSVLTRDLSSLLVCTPLIFILKMIDS